MPTCPWFVVLTQATEEERAGRRAAQEAITTGLERAAPVRRRAAQTLYIIVTGIIENIFPPTLELERRR